MTPTTLLGASLRMRPDRIILGELRGDEAFAFLRAINTGHPGSMTTVHADSAERAIEQIVLLALQAGHPIQPRRHPPLCAQHRRRLRPAERIAGRRRIAEIVLPAHWELTSAPLDRHHPSRERPGARG